MEETAFADGVWALRFTCSRAFFYIALFIKFVFQPQKEKKFLKENLMEEKLWSSYGEGRNILRLIRFKSILPCLNFSFSCSNFSIYPSTTQKNNFILWNYFFLTNFIKKNQKLVDSA